MAPIADVCSSSAVLMRDPAVAILQSSTISKECTMFSPSKSSSGLSVCSRFPPNVQIAAATKHPQVVCKGGADRRRFCSVNGQSSQAIQQFTGDFGLLPWRRPRVSKKASGTPISGPLSNTGYEFWEEGSELEVRVRIPSVEEAGRQLTARYVAVDTQSTSLVVAVETVHGIQILLNAGSLYGSVRPSETVWFVDETEIVLCLKKADDELSWPKLVEDWESLAKGVSALLKGISVYIVGESSDINWAVAQTLAEGLEYVPLQTRRLIEQVTSSSVEDLILGGDSISETEGTVLKSLGNHGRCVVATLGGLEGAAAQYDKWDGLHAGFSVWLSQSHAENEHVAKEEVVKAKQVRSKAYANADVAVAFSGWDSAAAGPTAEGVLRALKYLLLGEKDLPSKKSLYVRLGCRGDWPEIMPPGWDPAKPQDEVKMAQSVAL